MIDHWNMCSHTIVQCINDGCVELFKRKEEYEHDEKCYHRLVNCEHCNNRVKRGLLDDHLRICDEVEINCELGCGEKVKRKIKNHLESCLEEIINCIGRDVGCNFTDKRRTVVQHQTNCVCVNMRSAFQSLQGVVKTLEEKIEQQGNTIKSLEDIIYCLQRGLPTIEPRSLFYRTTRNQNILLLKTITVSEDQIIYSDPIPFYGIWKASFRILYDPGTNCNMIGIASSPSLVNSWLRTTHYVGWCISESSGILNGNDNRGKNIFYQKKRGPGRISSVKNNDLISVIFNAKERTLSFEKNGKKEPKSIVDIPEDTYYFVVGRFANTVIVTFEDIQKVF